VTASTGLTIHPAAVYIAARHARAGWIWNVGTPHRIELRAVRPDGRPIVGVPVQITVVRRHWAYGSVDVAGGPDGWRAVTDTVTRDSILSGDGAVGYVVTPRDGGDYRVRFTVARRAGTPRRDDGHGVRAGRRAALVDRRQSLSPPAGRDA
jgi:hypothetical protein